MRALSTVVLGLTLALGLSLAPEAQAAMVFQAPQASDAPIIQVFGGCGLMGHRGPFGGCRSGGQLGGYHRGRACPPGFHLGPAGRRCWPN